jgi:hypothetical protein
LGDSLLGITEVDFRYEENKKNIASAPVEYEKTKEVFAIL